MFFDMFKKDTNKKEETIVDTTPEIPKIEEDEEIEIIAGENTFETKMLTWLNYLTKFSADYVKGIDFGYRFNKGKNIEEFLTLSIDNKNFIFVEEFATMYKTISELFMIPKYMEYEENKELNSKTVSFTTEQGIHFKFDFFKVPDKVSSLLEDDLLDNYLYDDNNNEFVTIYVNYKDILFDIDKEITIKNYKELNIKESYVDIKYKYILDFIMTSTCKWVFDTFDNMLTDTSNIYFGRIKNLSKPYYSRERINSRDKYR